MNQPKPRPWADRIVYTALALVFILGAVKLHGDTPRPSKCSTGCGPVLAVRTDTETVAPERVTYDLDGDGVPEVVIEGETIRLKIDGCPERSYDPATGTWLVECGGAEQ